MASPERYQQAIGASSDSRWNVQESLRYFLFFLEPFFLGGGANIDQKIGVGTVVVHINVGYDDKDNFTIREDPKSERPACSSGNN